MKIDTTYRSSAPEIMDDFSLKGKELEDALDKIAKINRLLGGNNVTLRGVEKLLKHKSGKITIVDAGCGNGDMLRFLADYGKKQNLNMRLIGIDANAFTVSQAEKLSQNYPQTEYRCADVFDELEKITDCDIILCTLTMHHFKDEQIISLMDMFYRNAKLGIVVNDLQRSAVAYRLFQLVCFVFRLNTMSRKDGLVSILRGFKKRELIDYSTKLNFKKYMIRWKWAFRYQWIVSKI
ncbi:MAG TPA: methyltransferase domain-containing protein [Flavobacterium sp.]|jgi:2-polyprenyl-3-methyl-5-hydroxy-6-metoxy-1,4-benzoquinol methylase